MYPILSSFNFYSCKPDATPSKSELDCFLVKSIVVILSGFQIIFPELRLCNFSENKFPWNIKINQVKSEKC